MPLVMARHDAVSKSAVERNRGTIVKMTGDGIHAAFDRPLDALIATLEIQQQLSTAETADGLPLPLRCGLHAGIDERRDGDDDSNGDAHPSRALRGVRDRRLW